MIPELKRYYIMQLSYWCQQLIVLLLGLEKPRKDYKELVAHHFVTLWLIRSVLNLPLCDFINTYPSSAAGATSLISHSSEMQFILAWISPMSSWQ